MYEYKVMPFGLANASSVFQRYRNNILKEHIDKGVVEYIDDILIYATSEQELIQLTTQVLTKLEDNSLCVNAKKCVVHQHEIEFVGFTIGHNGIRMSANKVKDIIEWEEPRSVHEVQQFLGFANFYRRFIKGYSGVARSLSNLTKKGQPCNWRNECQRAFDELEQPFILAPILVNYHPQCQKIIVTNASDLAQGAVLN